MHSKEKKNQFILESAFEQKKKKSGLEFNPMLALTGL